MMKSLMLIVGIFSAAPVALWSQGTEICKCTEEQLKPLEQDLAEQTFLQQTYEEWAKKIPADFKTVQDVQNHTAQALQNHSHDANPKTIGTLHGAHAERGIDVTRSNCPEMEYVYDKHGNHISTREIPNDTKPPAGAKIGSQGGNLGRQMETASRLTPKAYDKQSSGEACHAAIKDAVARMIAAHEQVHKNMCREAWDKWEHTKTCVDIGRTRCTPLSPELDTVEWFIKSDAKAYAAGVENLKASLDFPKNCCESPESKADSIVDRQGKGKSRESIRRCPAAVPTPTPPIKVLPPRL